MTGAVTWARLTFRLQRSSIAFAALVCLGLAGTAAWLAVNLPSRTVSLLGSPLGEPVMLTQLVIGVAMYAVPLVLGVPILAQEVEHRTAMIAWPLAGSRLKWLSWRAGSVIVIGLVLIGIMAVAAEVLASAEAPDSELGFLSHGSRGISLIMRSILTLVVALALGAVIGRLLPSLLIGVAFAVVISTAVGSLVPFGVEPTEITPTAVTPTEAFYEGGPPLQTGHSYRAPDGTPISDDEAEAMSMAVFAEYSPELPPDSELPQDVVHGIDGSRYFEVLARESAVLGGVTILAAGVAAAVVQRRRPE